MASSCDGASQFLLSRPVCISILEVLVQLPRSHDALSEHQARSLLQIQPLSVSLVLQMCDELDAD